MASAYLVIFLVIMFIWLFKLDSRLNDCEATLKRLNRKIYFEERKKYRHTSENQVSEEIPIIEKESTTDEWSDDEWVDETDKEEIVHNYETTKKTYTSEKKLSKASSNDGSLENFFLGNAFTIVGALALIISTGIFIKIISSFIVFTPVMKTIIGFILGAILILISSNLKNDKMKMYSEVLMGTGFSVFFITTLCTATLFKTFDNLTCVFIGAIILLLSYLVADKQKTISMILIALIGGYLNICFVAQSIDFALAFGYLIFLNLLSIIYVYRNPSKSIINIVNLGITLLITASFMIASSNVHPAYPVILWLIYLVYDVVKTNQGLKDDEQLQILSWTNFGILTLFSIFLFRDEKLYIGSILIISAIMYNLITGYFMMKGTEKYKPYLYSLLITLLLAVYFLADGVLRIAIWSVLGIILALVVSRLKRDYLASWILMYLGAATTGIFFIEGIPSLLLEGYTPIWNERLLTFAMPILTTYASYKLLAISENRNTKNISQILRFLFLSLIYLFVVFEINNYFLAGTELGTWSKVFIKMMILAIIGFKYALQMKKIGMDTKFVLFETASYVVGTLSLILLLCFGLNYPNQHNFVPICNIRFLAFASAIITSILFIRWTKEEFFKYLAVILGFILLTVEVYDCIGTHFDNHYIVSVFWMLYSGIITTIGILSNKKFLKNVGIFTSVLTLAKVLFFDIAGLEATYKLIVFMLVGIVLMLVSYLYNKYKD